MSLVRKVSLMVKFPGVMRDAEKGRSWEWRTYVTEDEGDEEDACSDAVVEDCV